MKEWLARGVQEAAPHALLQGLNVPIEPPTAEALPLIARLLSHPEDPFSAQGEQTFSRIERGQGKGLENGDHLVPLLQSDRIIQEIHALCG